MRILDLRGRHLSKSEYQTLLPRAPFDVAAALGSVTPIIERVKKDGERALFELAEEFDGVRPKSIKVPRELLEESLKTLDTKVLEALKESIRRVRIVHKDQIRGESTTRVVDGGEVVERWVPVDRVGLYVPAGKAVYPSSVIMNVVPAQIAGVKIGRAHV